MPPPDDIRIVIPDRNNNSGQNTFGYAPINASRGPKRPSRGPSGRFRKRPRTGQRPEEQGSRERTSPSSLEIRTSRNQERRRTERKGEEISTTVTNTLTARQKEEANFIEYMESFRESGLVKHRSNVSGHMRAFVQYVTHSNTKVGTQWEAGFKERNPGTNSWYQYPSESSPDGCLVDSSLSKNCRILQRLNALMKRYSISKERLYIAKETGYLASGKRKARVTVHRPQRPSEVRRDAPSCIQTFSASGRAIDPYFIFAPNQQARPRIGKAVPFHTTSGHPVLVYHKAGEWADENCLMEWLWENFLPQTGAQTGAVGTPDDPSPPYRILVLEEERFSVSREFYAHCWANHIFILSIPRTESGSIILKVFDDLVSSLFGEPYDTFAKREMAAGDKEFSVRKDKFIDFFYGQTHDRKLRDSLKIKKAWKESFLMPPNPSGLRTHVERCKPTPGGRNRQLSVSRSDLSMSANLSSPPDLPGRVRSQTSPLVRKRSRIERSTSQDQLHTPETQATVDHYPYRENDWSGRQSFSSIEDDDYDQDEDDYPSEPPLPTPSVSGNDRTDPDWRVPRPHVPRDRHQPRESTTPRLRGSSRDTSTIRGLMTPNQRRDEFSRQVDEILRTASDSIRNLSDTIWSERSF